MTCLINFQPHTQALVADKLTAAFHNGVNIDLAKEAIALLNALGVTLPVIGKNVALEHTAKLLGTSFNRCWNGANRDDIRAVKKALPRCEDNCDCVREHYRSELEVDLQAVAEKNAKVESLEVNLSADKTGYVVSTLLLEEDGSTSKIEWTHSGKDASRRRIKKLGRTRRPRGTHLNEQSFKDLEDLANQLLAKVDPWGTFSICAIRPVDSPEGRETFMQKYKQSQKFPLQLMFLGTPEAIVHLRSLKEPSFNEDTLLGWIRSRELQQRLRLALRSAELPPGNFVYTVCPTNDRKLTMVDTKSNAKYTFYPSNESKGRPTLKQPTKLTHQPENEDVVYAYKLTYSWETYRTKLIKFGRTKITWIDGEDRDYLSRILSQRKKYLGQLNGEWDNVELLGVQVCSSDFAASQLEGKLKQATQMYDFQSIAPTEFNDRIRIGSELRTELAEKTILALLGEADG